MQTLADLLNPLALCALEPDVARCQLLMRGVLGVMTAAVREAPNDPIWPVLSSLVVQGNARQGGATRRVEPQVDQGLRLSFDLQAEPQWTGQTVVLKWPLGGAVTVVIGLLLQHAPVSVYIKREWYAAAGYPVPDFVRAYDGLRLLGVSGPDAAHLVERYPGGVLLKAVKTTYQTRDRLRSPEAYLRALLNTAA